MTINRPPVKFDAALDATGKVVKVYDALPGAAYVCRGCGAAVIFIPQGLYQAHFRHKVRENTLEGRCDYTEETYVHREAKKILQRLGWVRVPAVMPRRLEDYSGPVQPLRPAYDVTAAEVMAERRLYEGPDCNLLFERVKGVPTEEPGKVDFICQPDILFTNAQGDLQLLIEIHVTHRTEEKKIAGIRRAQVDAIEISVPWWYSPLEIERLLTSGQNTKWLYNNERELAPAVGADSYSGTAPGGGFTYQVPTPEPEPGESIECQIHEIKEAVRSLGKCLDLPDVGAAIAAIEDAQRNLRFAEADVALEYQREFERAERSFLAGLRDQTSSIELDQRDVNEALGRRTAEAKIIVQRDFDPAARAIADATTAVREQQSHLDSIRARMAERYRKRRAGLQAEIDRVGAEESELARLQRMADGLDREEEYVRGTYTRLDEMGRELAEEEAELAREENAAEQQRLVRAQQLAQSADAAGILRLGFERAYQAMDAELAAVTAGLARARNTNDILRRLKRGAIENRFGGRNGVS